MARIPGYSWRPKVQPAKSVQTFVAPAALKRHRYTMADDDDWDEDGDRDYAMSDDDGYLDDSDFRAPLPDEAPPMMFTGSSFGFPELSEQTLNINQQGTTLNQLSDQQLDQSIGADPSVQSFFPSIPCIALPQAAPDTIKSDQ